MIELETEGVPLDAPSDRAAAIAAISDGFTAAWEGRRRAMAVRDGMAARAYQPKAEAPDAPTPERQRQGKVLHPETTREVRREAYRAMDEVEAAHRKGEVETAELEAWRRFQVHYAGAQGARIAFDFGNGDANEDGPLIVCRHGQALKLAREALLPREFLALEDLAEGRRNFADVGREVRATTKRETARGQGLVAVRSALGRLAQLWGGSAPLGELAARVHRPTAEELKWAKEKARELGYEPLP